MKRSRFALVFGCVALAGSALAQPAPDAPLAPVKAFVAAINAGNTADAVATMTAEPAITDEFPPFHWQGKGAVAAWMDGDAADAKAHGVTDGVVSIGAPVHLSIAGGHGFAVVPMQYAYQEGGKKVTEMALLTVSLVDQDGKWLMSSWAYGLK